MTVQSIPLWVSAFTSPTCDEKGRGGRSTDGPGVASRAISTLRALLGHATRLGIIGKNPAQGVRQLAIGSPKRRLSEDEIRRLGRAMRGAAADGEYPTGLAAIRLMLLTGFRPMEVLGLSGHGSVGATTAFAFQAAAALNIRLAYEGQSI